MFYGGQVKAANSTVIDNNKLNGNINADITIHGSNSDTNNLNSVIDGSNLYSGIPVFAKWKGEEANNALEAAWRVSGGDKSFVLTMLAENGTFDPYRKHPIQNRDKSWDYSFGLNSYYHKEMIARIKTKTVSVDEIMEYHWKIYNQPDWTTACGKKKFCGYNKINTSRIKNQIIWPK